MTQNKLTPDELAMLDEYIEYGEQNSFEYIAVQKVYEALRITKAQAQKIKESDEYIELKRAISKFDDKRKFGFGTFQNFYKWYKKNHKSVIIAISNKMSLMNCGAKNSFRPKLTNLVQPCT